MEFKMRYNFGNKAQYRRTLWNFLESYWPNIPIKERTAFILDTAQGLETAFLIDRGYSPKNIHVCNANPAEVAHITRGLKAKCDVSVNTYGLDVAAAFKKAVSNQQVQCANIDLCGPTSESLATRLKTISDFLPSRIAVSISILRGRERSAMFGCFQSLSKVLKSPELNLHSMGIRETFLADLITDGGLDLSDTDIGRLLFTEGWITNGSFHKIRRGIGTYRSEAGNQTMMWIGLHLKSLNGGTLSNDVN